MRVDTRPVRVTVDNKTSVYGSPNPKFTATVTGMPAGDDAADVSSRPMPRDLGVGYADSLQCQREDDRNLEVRGAGAGR